MLYSLGYHELGGALEYTAIFLLVDNRIKRLLLSLTTHLGLCSLENVLGSLDRSLMCSRDTIETGDVENPYSSSGRGCLMARYRRLLSRYFAVTVVGRLLSNALRISELMLSTNILMRSRGLLLRTPRSLSGCPLEAVSVFVSIR